MMEFLPIDRPIDESINSLMNYFGQSDLPRITAWNHIVLSPFPAVIYHQLFFYDDGPDAFICFLVNQKATFLPDWLSKILQLYGGYHLVDNTPNLYGVKELVYKILALFVRLCQIRLTLSFWLIFNPYTYPWRILIELTEWFVEGFSGLLPVFFGIEFSNALGIGGLSVLLNYIKNLVFTMPYLPSEGVKEIVGKYPVYRFHGFPRLWAEYGIPNELREKWYNRQPEVIEHFLKYYGTVGQDIVPNKVVEDYYNQYIKDTTISTSLANLDSLSTNLISYFNNVFHTDFVTNQIIPISDKLLHNF